MSEKQQALKDNQQPPKGISNQQFNQGQQDQQFIQDGQNNKKKKQAQMFKKYLQQTGIAMAFQVIFAEILDKKIQQQKVFTYTAMRLRQIGQDLQKIKLSKK